MAIDDLIAEISGGLGEETHISDWQKIDQYMINAFADVTQDHQGSMLTLIELRKNHLSKGQ